MSEPAATERERAISFVLGVLRSPLALLSPSREEALRLATEYGITAEELLRYGQRRVRNT